VSDRASLHARLAQLQRQQAEVHEQLAALELAAPARARRPAIRAPRKLRSTPTELQQARARKTLQAKGILR